jgi:hypothetical protein
MHAVQIKKARPIKVEVVKRFCSRAYYNFLGKNRTAAQWDELEKLVREGNADSHPEAADLESFGIMACFAKLSVLCEALV